MLVSRWVEVIALPQRRGSMLCAAAAVGLTLGCAAPPAPPSTPPVNTADEAGSSAPTPQTSNPAESKTGGSTAESKTGGSTAETAPGPQRLPPLCVVSEGLRGCAQILEIESDLEDGAHNSDQAETVRRKLRELGALLASDPSAERSTQLLSYLKARYYMAEANQAFGAGGAPAEQALQLLDSIPDAVERPENDRIRFERARALLASGASGPALLLLEQLGASYPGHAEVQAGWGVALLASGAVQKSLAHLQKATQLAPQEAEYKLSLGTVYFLLGRSAEAERTYRGALAVAHSDEALARGYGDLGALYLAQGKAEDGESLLRRALAIYPERATFLSNLAYAELLLGRLDEAFELAQRATRYDPELVSGWLNLGLVQEARGEREAARRSFEHAQELDPDDPRPQNNLNDLRELEEQGQ